VSWLSLPAPARPSCGAYGCTNGPCRPAMRRVPRSPDVRSVATLLDLLPRHRQLELAVRTKDPACVARTFAGYLGLFYDRAPFDAVAREVYALYAVDSDQSAACFRHRLDRHARERGRPPVAWEAGPEREEDAP
jgi:hypothetical protein